MAELYLFDQDDNFITILSKDEGLVDSWFKDYENHIPDESFIFNVDSNSELLQYIIEENQVAFYDRDNDLRLMRMKELYEVSTKDGHNIRVKCEPSFLELYDHFIEDRRITNGTAQTALDRALDGSRYIGEVTVDLGLATDNLYWIDGIEAVFKILGTWGGSLKDTITLNDKNEIIERKLWIVQRLGTDNGLIVEPDYNAEMISRNTLSYTETALWGQGASLETDNGGYTRYITFEDVEWSKSKGDPVDKPKGQKWVGDPQALANDGLLHNGVRKHKFGHYNNFEIEDPEELLWATWNELQERKLKEIIHEATIFESDKKVSLGDTVTILNRKYNKPIELQSQITGLEYDVLLPDDEINIVVGKYIDMNEDPLQKEVDDLKEQVKKPRPTTVTDGSYPDHKPSTPVNVEAIGGIETIQLYWDYADEIFIKHYEVYGSQIKDFVPDEQHLLWRGQVSAFAHTVGTDQKWYYRIRAVNYQGRASDWSVQVEASTRRVISDDILFGEILSDHLSDNLDIADKLAQNTIDRINADPMEAIEYTQEEIEATENRLLDQLDNRIGDVNASINDLLERASGIEGTVTNIERNIDTIEGTLSTTITQLTNLDDVVSQHTLDIKANADGLSAKAEKSEVYTRTATDNLLGDKVDLTVYNNKVTQLDIDISGISGRVSNTETNINDLTGEMSSALSQIGELDVRANKVEISVSEVRKNIEGMGLGENLIPNGSFENDDFGWRLHSRSSIYSSDSKMGSKSLRITSGSGTISQSLNVDEIEVIPGHTYRIEYWCKTSSDFNGVSGNNKLRFGFSSNETSTVHNSIGWTGAETEWVKKTGTWKIPNDVSKVKPQIMSNHTTGWVLWDGIVFKDITEISQLSSEVTKLDSSITTLAGQVELKASQTSVNSLTGRMSNAESSITTNANNIKLKVDVDGVIASINLSKEGLRIDGNKHHITGQTKIDDAVIGTGAIANAAISRAKLQEAIITTAHVDYLSGTKLVAGTVDADRLNVANLAAITANLGTVTAGILRSKNNNMDLNLNTGNLTMQNANFTLGGGAQIDFVSSGNRINYRLYDTQSGFNRVAGFGVGNALGGRYPFAHVGTTGSGEMDTLSEYYSGFIANTTARIDEGGANSVSGYRFMLRNIANNWTKGIEFDFYGSSPFIRPINGHEYNYEIGTSVYRFSRLYVDRISTKSDFTITHYSSTAGRPGWRLETAYSGEGNDITLRGINGGSYEYQIGRPSTNNRIRHIFLKNNPNVSSDERLKTEISDLDLGLEFINNIDAKQFRLKLSDADINQGKFQNVIQYGIIAQQVNTVLSEFGVHENSLITEGEDGYYGAQYEQFIPVLIRSDQELDRKFTDEVEKLKLKIQYLEGKIKQLEGAA